MRSDRLGSDEGVFFKFIYLSMMDGSTCRCGNS